MWIATHKCMEGGNVKEKKAPWCRNRTCQGIFSIIFPKTISIIIKGTLQQKPMIST
jgi:hypothetical protein